MCFFFSLMPATILITIGYFVLFSTTKAEGAVVMCGRILAVWIFILALLPPLIGAYLTLSGLCPIDKILSDLGAS